MGGKSSSSSNSSSDTTDAKVAAEDGGVAIGQGATVTINSSFDENVAEFGLALIELAADAGSAAIDGLNTANASQLDTLNRLNDSEATTTIKDILVIGGTAAVIIFVAPKLFK